MTLDPVITLEEAFAVALIRNECCQWMTNDQDVLDVERQLKFYNLLKRSAGTRLFIARHNKVPCGYAVLQVHDEKALLSLGLAKPFRGKGLGKLLCQRLIDYSLRRWMKPWLMVLRSNRRAIHVYKSLGFKVTEQTKRLLTMDYRP